MNASGGQIVVTLEVPASPLPGASQPGSGQGPSAGVGAPPAPRGGNPDLPTTGFAVDHLLVIAVLLMCVGALLVAATRQRNQEASHVQG